MYTYFGLSLIAAIYMQSKLALILFIILQQTMLAYFDEQRRMFMFILKLLVF